MYDAKIIATAKRRRALLRLHMARTSCLTEFGHRWRGSVWPFPKDVGLWGNMVVASVMASPRMVYMSPTRKSTDSRPPN